MFVCSSHWCTPVSCTRSTSASSRACLWPLLISLFVYLFVCLFVCATQSHRVFLHTLYQRLITGKVYVSSPDAALSRYSWADLSNLVSEQVAALLSEISRANERVRTQTLWPRRPTCLFWLGRKWVERSVIIVLVLAPRYSEQERTRFVTFHCSGGNEREELPSG